MLLNIVGIYVLLLMMSHLDLRTPITQTKHVKNYIISLWTNKTNPFKENNNK